MLNAHTELPFGDPSKEPQQPAACACLHTYSDSARTALPTVPSLSRQEATDPAAALFC